MFVFIWNLIKVLTSLLGTTEFVKSVRYWHILKDINNLCVWSPTLTSNNAERSIINNINIKNICNICNFRFVCQSATFLSYNSPRWNIYSFKHKRLTLTWIRKCFSWGCGWDGVSDILIIKHTLSSLLSPLYSMQMSDMSDPIIRAQSLSTSAHLLDIIRK